MRRNRGRLRHLSATASLSAAGLTLAFSVIIGIGIGYLLDRWLGTDPWFTVIFLLIGFAAGIVELIRAVARASEDEEHHRD